MIPPSQQPDRRDDEDRRWAWVHGVLELLETPVFVLSEDVNEVVDCNRAAEQLFASDRRELLNATTYDMSRPRDHEMVRTVGAAFSSGTISSHMVDKTFLRLDGTQFKGRIRMTALPHPDMGRVVVSQIYVDGDNNDSDTTPSAVRSQNAWRKAYNQALDRRGDGIANMTIAAIGIRNVERTMERLGWTSGKALSAAVAGRVSETLRSVDVLVELYGGTTAILLDGIVDPAAAESIVGRMISMFDHPVYVSGEPEHVDVQAGAVCLDGPAIDGDAALTMAVVALNAARASGKPVSVFDPATARRRRGERVLEERVCAAIASGAVRGAIQPIVSLSTYEMVGIEALARLNVAPVGDVSPDSFIPLASHRGLIPRVTEQVMADGLDALRRIAHLETGLTMSLNVSGEQLVAGFPDWLAEHLPDEVGPEQLQIEVTESVLIERQQSLSVLNELADLGYQIAIDDFGTGYSSLTYLSEWPAHVLKLDKSFVGPVDTGNERSMSIVRSVIGLAGEMGMITVAEGVERPGQLELLRNWGCDRVQGYLLSKPVWPDQLPAVYQSLRSTAELVIRGDTWSDAIETLADHNDVLDDGSSAA